MNKVLALSLCRAVVAIAATFFFLPSASAQASTQLDQGFENEAEASWSSSTTASTTTIPETNPSLATCGFFCIIRKSDTVNDLSTVIAIAQESWAGQRNLDSLGKWKSTKGQGKGVGFVEFNTGSDFLVATAFSVGLTKRWWNKWHHKKKTAGIMDTAVNSVLVSR